MKTDLTHLPSPARQFSQRFSSTRRGARLSRLLALQQLEDWGHPRTSPLAEAAESVVGELAVNAVTHGHVPGWSFGLRLTHVPSVLWVEVTDSREDAVPAPPARVGEPHPDFVSETGRGLLIVAILAARWGVLPHGPGGEPGKTVWAELREPDHGPGHGPERAPGCSPG